MHSHALNTILLSVADSRISREMHVIIFFVNEISRRPNCIYFLQNQCTNFSLGGRSNAYVDNNIDILM